MILNCKYGTNLPVIQIQDIGLSFKSAKDLSSRAEILPNFKPHPHAPHTGQDLQWATDPRHGLRWVSKRIIPETPTKNDLVLYYRDPLLCLQYLMHNPLVQVHISFTPFKLYESAAKSMRIYTEWLSSEQAWNIQVISPFSLMYFLDDLFTTGPTWSQSDSSWCGFIFRQNEYLCNDWRTFGTSPPHQLSQHLYGVSE